MISSTPTVACVDSMGLGVQLLKWSSLMAFNLSNWLVVGVDGKTNISSSPWLITPCNSWAHRFPAH